MNNLVLIIEIMCWCFAIPVIVFVTLVCLYMLKQITWEINLKHYKVTENGNVVNPQGFVIEKPAVLLKELQGIEEKIAK